MDYVNICTALLSQDTSTAGVVEMQISIKEHKGRPCMNLVKEALLWNIMVLLLLEKECCK